MKPIVPITLVAIGLGFAAGWFANQNNSPATAEAESNSPAVESSSRKGNRTSSATSSSAETRANRKKPSKPEVAESIVPGMQLSEEQMEKMQKRQQEMMRKIYGKKHEARIKKLVAALGLNADQEKQLRAYFAKKTEAMAGMVGGDGTTDLSATKGDGLDGALASILSDEQKQAYDELVKRERKSKIESRALSKLANIQRKLDLTDEQKDGVYQILLEDAAKQVDRRENDLVSSITSAFGVDLGGGDLDAAMVVPDGIEGADGEGQPDRASIMKRLKEAQQKRIDAQVERLAPVLSEQQQKQYRESLEGQGSLIDGLLQSSSEDGNGNSVIIRRSVGVPVPEEK
ncbi:MAG: hypothetical protein ACPG32_13285 [Akkermansiaceae bacterium]